MTFQVLPSKASVDPDWWKHAVIYQIYPRSFADGDGDGIGDLAGIVDRLPYVRSLGVDAIWISPFYPSPQHDAGYDVADYFNIDPVFGTLQEFDALVQRSHQLGMRVIIDVVPNHTSSEHPWFQAAMAGSPTCAERNRYHFRYRMEGPPNNWGSLFGGSAWTPVEELSGNPADAGWWYLHLFDTHQPDLNWENPEVRAEFERYLAFWLDRGVDGFRVDVAHGLVKAPGLPDDSIGPDRFAWVPPGSDGVARKAPDVGPNFDQDAVHDIYRSWRSVLDRYGSDRILVAEAWVEDPERLAAYVRSDEMNHAFNFRVLKCGWKATELRRAIAGTHDANASRGAVDTWVLSNHDVVRHATRLGYPYGAETSEGIGPTDPQPDAECGLSRALALTSFLMALPGAMYLYNGEELGLPEATSLPDSVRQDPTWTRSRYRVRGRDGCRVPLPWKATEPGFGFGSAQPWLPQPENWMALAVDVQEIKHDSPLRQYRYLIELRQSLGLGLGDLTWIEAHPDILAIRNGTLVAAVNTGPIPREIPIQGSVVHLSGSRRTCTADLWAAREGHLVLEPNRCVWILCEHRSED